MDNIVVDLGWELDEDMYESRSQNVPSSRVWGNHSNLIPDDTMLETASSDEVVVCSGMDMPPPEHRRYVRRLDLCRLCVDMLGA